VSARPITRLDDLVAHGLVPTESVDALAPVVERFQLRITSDLAEVIDLEETHGPVARQFVPDVRELDVRPNELADPIGDDVYSPVRGITHRYPDRVLLKPTHLCQVYCRFCFRREKVGDGAEQLSEGEIDTALAYIASHEEIFEVILTGGDPFVLSDRRLVRILDGIEAIPHVAVVRLHTRVPTVDPARITPELVALLRRRFATWVGVHVNHASELTDSASQAIARLVDGGIPLISQTVLLAGVNDTVEALSDLMRALVARRVKPYYLHHLDLAEGTGHFRTSIEAGKTLVMALRGNLTGLAQPTYVLDIPGGFGKAPITAEWVEPTSETAYNVRDWQGDTHAYIDTKGGRS
jgi:lysine 2,3-aminomutase